MVMPISFLLQQQNQEEVPDEETEDSQRRDDRAPEVEMERSPVPDISPPSRPPPASATPLLTLQAHHIQHNTLRSTFMSVPGS